MEVLTVVFTHWKWEFLEPFYKWNKERCPSIKYIWDTTDLDPEEISNVTDNPDFMPMKLESLWKNMTRYFPQCLTWFQRENPDIFLLLESDAIIGTHTFVEKSVRYMKEHNIQAMFPWIKSETTDPKHPFAQSLRSVQPKLWTVPGCACFYTKEALNFYGQSFIHIPDYWNEIRIPSELAKNSFIISPNPYTNHMAMHTAEGNKDERTDKSLTKEEIKNSIEHGYEAFHPIKDPILLDYITELLNEKQKS